MSNYQPNTAKFKDSPREDLNIYELMLSLGFTPKYHSSDIWNNREIPANSVSYFKDDLHFWRIYVNNGNQWTSAKLINMYFCEHVQYKNVEEFLEKCLDIKK